jgi:hypothetical protein
MPSCRPSWLVRSIGLALARHSLRRTLEAQGPERGTPLAAVLTGLLVDAHGIRGEARKPFGLERRGSAL